MSTAVVSELREIKLLLKRLLFILAPDHEIAATQRGRYVSGLLIMHGITQAELVEKTGLSQSFLSNIISGRRIGAKEKGRRARKIIAESLGMEIEDLWPKKAASV